MSKSQKILMLFAVFELVEAVFFAGSGYQGGGIGAWVGMAVALLSGILLFVAAKDAKKAFGAWLVILISLILSAAELIITVVRGKATTIIVVTSVIAIVLNLIAFVAVHNVRKAGAKLEQKK